MSKTRRIAIVQGHPDATAPHFNHVLAATYAGAARAAGHRVRTIEVAKLEFPVLRSAADFEKGAVPPDIARAQAALKWADHLVVFFPLWLGTMPALLKAFFEQVFRPDFAVDAGDGKRLPRQLLKGRSARIVVTMGMPGFLYRWFYRAHGLRGFERNILGFSGYAPVRDTLIGMIGAPDDRQRRKWLKTMEDLGQEAR